MGRLFFKVERPASGGVSADAFTVGANPEKIKLNVTDIVVG